MLKSEREGLVASRRVMRLSTFGEREAIYLGDGLTFSFTIGRRGIRELHQ